RESPPRDRQEVDMSTRSTRSAILSIALVLVGSVPAFAQNGAWTSITGTSTPGPRREFGSIFDRESQRFYLFDGFNGNPSGLSIPFKHGWALSVAGTPDWSNVPIPGAVPGQRHSPQWGYDAAQNRVLIFGGYGSHYPGDAYAYLNDVWQLDLNGTPHW